MVFLNVLFCFRSLRGVFSNDFCTLIFPSAEKADIDLDSDPYFLDSLSSFSSLSHRTFRKKLIWHYPSSSHHPWDIVLPDLC